MLKGPLGAVATPGWLPSLERVLFANSAQSRSTSTLVGAALIAAYVALDAISLFRPHLGLGIAPLKPAPALAFVCLYCFGPRLLTFALLAPIIAWAFERPPTTPWTAMLIAGPLMIAPFALAADFLRRRPTFDPRLSTAFDVLVLVSALFTAAFAATVMELAAFSVLDLIPPQDLLPSGRRALVGLLTGALFATPLLLMAVSGTMKWQWRSEMVLQSASIVAALAIVFGFEHATAFQLFYLLFLPMLWVTLRHGIAGAAIMLPLVQIGLIVGAAFRFGNAPGLLIIQVLMIALAVTALFVGAVVTEREVVARRLQDQQAALFRAMRVRSAGEAAVAIAHELNQPLAALSSYCELTRQAVASGDRDLALKASERLSDLCARANDILKSTRNLLSYERGDWQEHCIGRIAEGVVTLLRPEAERAGVTIEVENASNLPNVRVDKSQIEQAIYNIVANAIEAIADDRKSGLINVSTAARRGNLVVEVCDTGPGFPPGLAQSAASTFFTTKASGSGLGLGIARSVAEAHGGSLGICNGPIGAVVTLQFPLMDHSHG